MPNGSTTYHHPRWGKRETTVVFDICTAIRLITLGFGHSK